MPSTLHREMDEAGPLEHLHVFRRRGQRYGERLGELAETWNQALNQCRDITGAIDKALSDDHGLSNVDFEVLQQLHASRREDGLVPLGELGSHVYLSQSALSRLVGRLEAHGMLERQMSKEDRRSVCARLTPAGTQTFLARSAGCPGFQRWCRS